MRIIRYQQTNKETIHWGWLTDDKVGYLEGNPFSPFRRKEALLPLDSVQLHAPVVPGKIVCVGLNYATHAAEHEADIPSWPLIFLKPPSAVIGPGSPVLLPPQSQQVEHEAELAVVIGKTARWLSPEQAHEAILGYTAANDITARDLQLSDDQWTRAKGFDSFCPLGPWIETEFDPADVMLTCTVNGQMRQMASTRDMIFSVAQIIAFVSSIMTLDPGDVLLTGTPAGVAPLNVGDEVSVEIEGIGTLVNPVRQSKQP